MIILRRNQNMEKYPPRSVWIVCLLNEGRAKNDSKGQRIKNLTRQIFDEAEKRAMLIDLILVNNASTDNTKEILSEIKKTSSQIIVLDEPVQGKARAERKGFSYALTRLGKEKKIEAIVTMDADGEHDVLDMMEMCGTFTQEKPILVNGSRFLKVGQRNQKDEILRSLLVYLSDLPDGDVPDDPRCGGRVYDPRFIEKICPFAVSKNYGLQYEIIAWTLRLLKQGVLSGKILSVSLERYRPTRSKVFKKPQTQEINPELADLCCAISNVFGQKRGDELEGQAMIDQFGMHIGRIGLFRHLSDLFFKGKMVTDHGAQVAKEFMEAPPIN